MRVNPRSRLVLAALSLAVVALAMPALSTGAAGVERFATMKGNEEVPGPGDPNGKGDAVITLKKKKRKVCFDLTWEKLDGASAAHIHKGRKGVAGPIKVELFTADPELSGDASLDDCVKHVKKRKIRKIKRHPGRYYVNVHNSIYPDGAIRGQLER